MIVLITYKLTPNWDYTAFFNEIKRSPATTWWHYIDSTWLVKTTETPLEMQERFRPFINQGKDTILITKIDAQNYTGWLTKEAHQWIKDNR